MQDSSRIPKDADGLKAFTAEIDALSDDNRGLLTALNDVFFQEPDADVRNSLSAIQGSLATIAGFLEPFGRHHHNTMLFIQTIGEKIAEGTLPETSHEHIRLLKDKILAEDTKGLLQSSQDDLMRMLTDLNSSVEQLREALARLLPLGWNLPLPFPARQPRQCDDATAEQR